MSIKVYYKGEWREWGGMSKEELEGWMEENKGRVRWSIE